MFWNKLSRCTMHLFFSENFVTYIWNLFNYPRELSIIRVYQGFRLLNFLLFFEASEPLKTINPAQRVLIVSILSNCVYNYWITHNKNCSNSPKFTNNRLLTDQKLTNFDHQIISYVISNNRSALNIPTGAWYKKKVGVFFNSSYIPI